MNKIKLQRPLSIRQFILGETTTSTNTISSRGFQWMTGFTESTHSVMLLALNAFGEALLFFILPDFLLLWICIHSKSLCRQALFLSVSICSSLTGTALMLYICGNYHSTVGSIIFNLPFTHYEMLSKIDSSNSRSLIFQAFSGVPIKVWVYQATSLGDISSIDFVLFTYIGRGVRMLLVCSVGTLLSRNKVVMNIIEKQWLGFFTCSLISLLILLLISSIEGYAL